MKRNYFEVGLLGSFGVRGNYRGLSFLLSLLLAVGFWPAQGQVGAGSLSGIVEDQTGAIVPGASVTVQNAASGAQRTSPSNGAGSFTFSALPSGDYTLTIKAPGFKQLVRSAIHLNAGDSLALSDLHLDVGDVSQTVSVNTTVAGLPLDSGQLSSTITAENLDQL